MAFRGEQITVGTTPVELTQYAESDSVSGRSLGITKCASDLYLGATAAATTTAAGAVLPAGTPLSVDLAHGDHVWAVVASGTAVVHVIETGV